MTSTNSNKSVAARGAVRQINAWQALLGVPKNSGTGSSKIVSRWRSKHFVPVRKAQLIELLCEDQKLGTVEREQFRQLCAVLEATIHQDYHRRLEELKNLYAPLNPDAVTCDVRPITDAHRSRTGQR